MVDRSKAGSLTCPSGQHSKCADSSSRLEIKCSARSGDAAVLPARLVVTWMTAAVTRMLKLPTTVTWTI
jgi:hypothetical protein